MTCLRRSQAQLNYWSTMHFSPLMKRAILLALVLLPPSVFLGVLAGIVGGANPANLPTAFRTMLLGTALLAAALSKVCVRAVGWQKSSVAALSGCLYVCVLIAASYYIAGRDSFQESARSEMSGLVAGEPTGRLLHSVNELPQSIRNLVGPIADRNRPFASGCVSRGGVPHQRFLAAAKLDSLYVVAIEYGGIVHGSETLRYAVDASGNAVALR